MLDLDKGLKSETAQTPGDSEVWKAAWSPREVLWAVIGADAGLAESRSVKCVLCLSAYAAPPLAIWLQGRWRAFPSSRHTSPSNSDKWDGAAPAKRAYNLSKYNAIEGWRNIASLSLSSSLRLQSFSPLLSFSIIVQSRTSVSVCREQWRHESEFTQRLYHGWHSWPINIINISANQLAWPNFHMANVVCSFTF